MSKAVGVVSFLLGVAAGSLVTYHALKEKYEKIAQSEIDSVKKCFAERHNNCTKVEESKPEYEQLLKDKGYVNYSNMSQSQNEPEETVKNEDRPYVISAEQFGEFEDYEALTLTYYDDEVLADDNLDIVDDIDNIVGAESLNHFVKDETDVVYVRNDAHKCDYEICRDEESYSELVRDKPYL